MKHLPIIGLTVALTLLTATSALAIEAKELGTQVLAQYQTIQAALAGDSVGGVVEAASQIADIVKPCDCSVEESEASQALVDAARGVDGSDLATVREQFKALSKAMPAYLKVTGVDSAQLYFCPMVKGYWLQPAGEATIHNPYLGKSMSTCGTKVERVAG